MKNIFRKNADLGEAERALKKWRIRYEKQNDGTLLVRGDVDIAGMKLEKLPDLSTVVVQGAFDCSDNSLTTLKGAPRNVGGNFDCSNNRLVSLEGGPETVGKGFFCIGNPLRSLDHKPVEFGVLVSDLGNQRGQQKPEPPAAETAAPTTLMRPIRFRAAASL